MEVGGHRKGGPRGLQHPEIDGPDPHKVPGNHQRGAHLDVREYPIRRYDRKELPF